MKEKISQLMDGELASDDVARVFAALKSDREAIEAWRTYHLISDSLRDTRLVSRGFTERVAARLAEEPVVLAPARWARAARRLPRIAAAAASVMAAVAFVGWSVTALREPGSAAQFAQSPKPAAVVAGIPAPKEAAKEPVRAALPEGARDYLLAHQGYAPRYALQGYARTVSDIAGSRR
ncbi:MAG: sigma-E factor negative regulatory protein [Pseudomonadota bacterium]